MVNVAFIRKHGCRVKRGFVADLPFGEPLSYVDPFIVVQIDEDTVPDGLIGNNTVKLKLDELMEKHPSTTEKYTDENGEEKERTVHGYFHEDGVSSLPYKVIEIGEVTWQ